MLTRYILTAVFAAVLLAVVWLIIQPAPAASQTLPTDRNTVAMEAVTTARLIAHADFLRNVCKVSVIVDHEDRKRGEIIRYNMALFQEAETLKLEELSQKHGAEKICRQLSLAYGLDKKKKDG